MLCTRHGERARHAFLRVRLRLGWGARMGQSTGATSPHERAIRIPQRPHRARRIALAHDRGVLPCKHPGNIIRIELEDPGEIGLVDDDDRRGGQNPRGVVLNSTDTRASVMDFLSRDVAVVDVSSDDPTLYRTLARIQSADLLAPGTDAATVQRGKYLFNIAIGPVGTQPNSVRPAGRMSDTGWGTCYSCHPNALTDTVTWMFADGPRQAISMESTFEFGAANIVNGVPALPVSHQRALNWSAVRDGVQDLLATSAPCLEEAG